MMSLSRLIMNNYNNYNHYDETLTPMSLTDIN